MPVSCRSFLFEWGHEWGFTSFSICLGSSYFQVNDCWKEWAEQGR